MRIALICRNLTIFDTDATLLQLAQEITQQGRECCIFTADKELKVQKPVLFASFYVVSGGQLQQIAVTEQRQGALRIFTISAASSTLFAAAVAGMARHLLLSEEKIDLLHLFSAADVCAALLCQQYFQIPFVYSVRELQEIKQRKQDFQDLSLTAPAQVFTVGDFILNEQLAAQEAAYMIDETGNPRLWREFFCAYAGKYIEGKPFINVSYWSQLKSTPRQTRKSELLQKLLSEKDFVVACEKPPVQPPVQPPALMGEVLFVSSNLNKTERLSLLQAADYYLVENLQPENLLTAMAAGCIPIAPVQSFTQSLIHDEEQQSAQATGYLYQQEGWPSVLQRACTDYRARPGQQQQLRQRGMMLIRDYFSIKTAAALYERIYHGSAPVRLPFIMENNRQPTATGVNEVQL